MKYKASNFHSYLYIIFDYYHVSKHNIHFFQHLETVEHNKSSYFEFAGYLLNNILEDLCYPEIVLILMYKAQFDGVINIDRVLFLKALHDFDKSSITFLLKT